MADANETWFVNRVEAAVSDDHYLDREEEKRLKEEAAARGMAIVDIERFLRREMDKHGAAQERTLIDELDRLLHQLTDNDRYLDGKEERNALAKVLRAGSGKKVGLDPRVAKLYVDSFCEVNGVRRVADRRWLVLVAGLVAIAVAAVGGVYVLLPREVERTVLKEVTKKELVDSAAYTLSSEDRSEIDDQLRRARLYADQAQYTDPPEKSAKASIDQIRVVDPRGSYRGDEVTALVDRIVDEYIALAQKSHASSESEGTRKWLDRAKPFNKNSEVIREKERSFGIVRAEQ